MSIKEHRFEICEKMNAERKKLGLTIGDVSSLIGISKAMGSSIFSTKNAPTRTTVESFEAIIKPLKLTKAARKAVKESK